MENSIGIQNLPCFIISDEHWDWGDGVAREHSDVESVQVCPDILDMSEHPHRSRHCINY